jgi:hypothetical protein
METSPKVTTKRRVTTTKTRKSERDARRRSGSPPV